MNELSSPKPFMGRGWLILASIMAWLLAPASTQAADASGASETSKFLRFIKTGPDEGRVETAVTTYRRADGAQATLVAAIHIADGAYFEKLQSRFKAFEAVLYEIVKPQDLSMAEARGTTSPVSALQNGIKNLLDLEFQLDAIDYSPTNFVHADMDSETFQRMQESKGESLLGILIRAMLEEHFRGKGPSHSMEGFQFLFALMSPDSAYQLKFLLAHQLENMESIMAGLDRGSDGQGSVLLSGRNEVAMNVLEQQLELGKRNLAIFYGAGHMIDFEKRLRKQGFLKTKEEWVTAWDIRKGKP